MTRPEGEPRPSGGGRLRVGLAPRRAGAYVLDITLLFAVLAPLGFLVEWLLGWWPRTGWEVWTAILWNFSLPVWLYFTWSDGSAGGSTLGKRLLRLRVADRAGGRLPWWRALLRTAVKLLPWELAHIASFALAGDAGTWSLTQFAALAAAYLLTAVYLVVAVLTGGRRSVHDYAAGSEVRGGKPYGC
jgi:uncharacterized RDD family membrane protein YckC